MQSCVCFGLQPVSREILYTGNRNDVCRRPVRVYGVGFETAVLMHWPLPLMPVVAAVASAAIVAAAAAAKRFAYLWFD
jgi:hypothetical protein